MFYNITHAIGYKHPIHIQKYVYLPKIQLEPRLQADSLVSPQDMGTEYIGGSAYKYTVSKLRTNKQAKHQ